MRQGQFGFRRFILLLGVVLGALAWRGTALAQAVPQATPCDTASACFDVFLSNASLTGDVYVDGVLSAAAVNSTRVTTTPGTPHSIEVKNIQDTTAGFGDLFVYPDLAQNNLSGSAGRTRSVRFAPTKNFVKGNLEFTCDLRGRRPADNVACRVTIDGLPQAADVAPNARVSYALTGGAHVIHTEVVGDQANNWSPITRDDTVTVAAGRNYVQTARLRASFALKGSIRMTLPKGLTADFYVDDVQIATQAAGAELFTASGPHKVEARAITDPAAGDAYKYDDVAQTVNVSSSSARTVFINPRKVFLKGQLAVSCQLTGKTNADDAACEVSVDGVVVGTVNANQRGTFNLDFGARSISVSVTGASASRWESPVTATQNIVGGRTSNYTARFKLKPNAPPPTTGGGGATGGSSGPGKNHLGTEKVVLADYFMFWDTATFTPDLMWDTPAAGGYNSSDGGTISRHVAQAQQACLNGFGAHWIGVNEGNTTGNFDQLLGASSGTNLQHAIVYIGNSFGASEGDIIASLNHVLSAWGQHPNYLRLGGKPVIIFTDMPRPWGNDAAALEGWKRVRAAVDPNHNSIWMAEGLTTMYNPTFDGLYVYRIDHRDYPSSWTKQARWANALRAAERQTGTGLYFADTIAPGFDDTRSVNLPNDARAAAPHFARDRRNGGYYADTFNATANTGGDMLFVKSFNEWIEGTEIEPGTTYGDLYLNLTCQYANTYRGR